MEANENSGFKGFPQSTQELLNQKRVYIFLRVN